MGDRVWDLGFRLLVGWIDGFVVHCDCLGEVLFDNGLGEAVELAS